MSDQHIIEIDPIAETKYYDVHCPQCGSVVQADLLAFDFGHVLRKALAIQKEIIRIYGSEEDLNYFKWDFLEDTELKLYFSIRDLQEFYKIKPEESTCFQFTCDDLKRHIMRLFDADWRDKENLVETFDKTLACWYDAAQNLVDKNRIPIQDRKKLGHLFLNPLDAMQITGNEYKEQLDKTISILNDLRDRSASQLGEENSEVIAEFLVQIHMEKDDMGRQMAGHITITYAEDYQRKRQQEHNDTGPYRNNHTVHQYFQNTLPALCRKHGGKIRRIAQNRKKPISCGKKRECPGHEFSADIQ